MSRYSYHNPQGNPCVKCGKELDAHRVAHIPEGDPCRKCGCSYAKHYRSKPDSTWQYYVGIDGEGQGRDDHRYVMLAWSSENGKHQGVIEAKEGGRLTTVECLEHILSTPNNARLFAYAFNYDLTKILTDLDDTTLYFLFRPDLRRNGKKTSPVTWGSYTLNLISTKFTISRGKKKRHIWDVFKFFQSRFTKALEDWKIGDERDIVRMAEMKEQRGNFDLLGREEIREYCLDECAKMATLARKLDEAHETAGLPLKAYFGAGSTSSAMLDLMDISNTTRHCDIEAMQSPIAIAFGGGRFENGRIGKVLSRIYGWDISSAYPYQMTFLPCLACGKWRHTKQRKALDGKHVATALVRYELGEPKRKQQSHWGPFPFRDETGSICYPIVSGGGWVYLDEYRAGERYWPNVRFGEAWVYETDCDHKPFERVPEFYLERLRWGKEGAGIVMKLGVNGGYGKLAQSVGNPKYQSWIWAGMITSGTRAQILDVLGMHRDMTNVLAIATDGIYSTENLELPRPKETGTDRVVESKTGDKTRKPLGGWERKVIDGGMFFARPGIYFPLELGDGADALKAMRARGVGRRAMLDNREVAIEAFARGEKVCRIAEVSRFHGAKSSVYRVGDTFRRMREYGQWTARPVEMSFDPMPKRSGVGEGGLLTARRVDGMSEPYSRVLSAGNIEAQALVKNMEELLEQPDGGDWSEYGDDWEIV